MLDINSPLEMALAYAGNGWAVLPLHTAVESVCDCRKACASPAKHPRTMAGFKDATTDEAKIRHWWGMWPEANIGIATGAVSGIFVVDIDPYHGGMETIETLKEKGIVLHQTAQVLTQNDGFHLYYQYAGKKGKGTMGKGIDVKSDGGYVVAPPSIGIQGRYTWQVAMEPQAF